MTRLTIIRGLPGSGKSTLAKQLIGDHFEADMFFVEDGVYKYDGLKIAEAHYWCLVQTKLSLESGRSAIVSNTFTRIKELRPYIRLAREMGLPRPSIITCQNKFGSIHGVPENVMYNMRERFTFDIEPLMEEYGY